MTFTPIDEAVSVRILPRQVSSDLRRGSKLSRSFLDNSIRQRRNARDVFSQTSTGHSVSRVELVRLMLGRKHSLAISRLRYKERTRTGSPVDSSPTFAISIS